MIAAHGIKARDIIDRCKQHGALNQNGRHRIIKEWEEVTDVDDEMDEERFESNTLGGNKMRKVVNTNQGRGNLILTIS